MREIVTQIRQSLSPAHTLAKFGHMSDWPTPDIVVTVTTTSSAWVGGCKSEDRLAAALSLGYIAVVSDDVPFWPTAQTALQELAERELQARVKAHYKYNGGEQEAAERFRAQLNARAQDAQRKWFRR